MPFDDTRRSGQGGSGDDNSADIAAVLYFLRGAANDCLLFNTYGGREAFDAFARLLKHDPAELWARTARLSE
jgi:hypothetical protein